MGKFLLISLLFLLLYACVPIVGVSTVGIVKTSVEIADDPRSLGRIVDDSVIEKKFLFKISQVDEKYLLKISSKSIDGRILLKGNVDTIKEKIQMTKIAWETDGVRSVENIIKVDDQSSWKDKAKDLSNAFIKELLEFKGVELVLLSKNFLYYLKVFLQP